MNKPFKKRGKSQAPRNYRLAERRDLVARRGVEFIVGMLTGPYPTPKEFVRALREGERSELCSGGAE